MASLGFEVLLGKERHKFSCGHFTVFSDGTVERLHGHNYHVAVTLRGPALRDGLLFPFHTVKATIAAICDDWDERILLPTRSAAVTIKAAGEQVEATVLVGAAARRKHYSLPAEDVVLLDCDNITCENLAQLAHARLLAQTDKDTLAALTDIVVTVSESDGQSVGYGGPLKAVGALAP